MYGSGASVGVSGLEYLTMEKGHQWERFEAVKTDLKRRWIVFGRFGRVGRLSA